MAVKSARETVFEMSRWFLVARAIHTAAELGLAQHIQSAPVSAEKIAQTLEVSPMYLTRLLRFLSGYQIFHEQQEGQFTATPLSQELLGAPEGIAEAMLLIDEHWWMAAGQLTAAVCTGKSGFEIAHGQTFHDYLTENTEAGKLFFDGVAAASTLDNQAITQAFDFGKFPTVCELRAKQKGMAPYLAQAFPDISIEQITPEDKPPASMACYLFKGILHDFDDRACKAILQQYARQLSEPEQRILIIEQLVASDNEASRNQLMDMMMMVLVPGQQRTLSHWQTLLSDCQLKLVSSTNTASSYCILEVAREETYAK